MRKLIIGKLILLTALFASLQGCNEYEMIKYSERATLNFMGKDAKGADSDEAATLKTSLNFGLNIKGDSVQIDTLTISVKVQGLIPERDMYLALKSVAIDGETQPEFSISNAPEDRYTMAAGKYIARLKVPVKRPTQRSKEYKCNLTFDFEKEGDFGRGTVERQLYEVTIQDNVTLELVGLTKDDWDYWGANTIGDYSENKLRFMIVVMETANMASIKYYGPNATVQKKLRDALVEYNATHDEPLKDENGNLINFDRK